MKLWGRDLLPERSRSPSSSRVWITNIARELLHRLGREANQGEVGAVIGGRYYGITEFDSA